jgi:hypothetical protein
MGLECFGEDSFSYLYSSSLPILETVTTLVLFMVNHESFSKDGLIQIRNREVFCTLMSFFRSGSRGCCNSWQDVRIAPIAKELKDVSRSCIGREVQGKTD